ncbi:hypothetical protein [Clostridium felsineum]|uniref:Uncharacterized protein n=1 Tax=Clostridium felsineum TaxID=36839 RepID=A0A1S8L1X9_9CLOT|nr:hypothetical protein [Clostridium felsineum]URZ05297.1 hypothetical protein CLROS_006210 [Clostridium felsineum]URZ10338.1 hypothetical protein CROST_010460 [Clostridium felsineum]
MSKFCGPLSAAATVLGMVDDGLNYKYGTQRCLIDAAGIAAGVIASVAIGAFLAPGLFAVGVGVGVAVGISIGTTWAKNTFCGGKNDEK